MAIDAGGWVPGALVRFGDLRFITNPECGLERVCAPVRPTDITCTDLAVNSLHGLWLDTPEAAAPTHPVTRRQSREHGAAARRISA